MLRAFNPVHLSDIHHLTSPYHINSLPITQGMSIQEMITTDQLSWCLCKLSLHVRNEICDNWKEKTHVDIGDQKVKYRVGRLTFWLRLNTVLAVVRSSERLLLEFQK